MNCIVCGNSTPRYKGGFRKTCSKRCLSVVNSRPPVAASRDTMTLHPWKRPVWSQLQ